MRTEIINLKIPYQNAGIPTPNKPARLKTYVLERPVYDSGGRMAVLICPGGGYREVSPREGEAVAIRLNAMGVHAFVLEYNVNQDRFPTQLLEAAAALALIRAHSKEWDIRPDQVLIMGFSAGGHLACSLGTFWNQEFLQQALAVGGNEIRPDGMILCYPVITSGKFAHQGSFENLLGVEKQDLRDFVSLEKQAGPQIPKTFLWHTWTDASVPVENSLLLAAAYKEYDINMELHLYPVGPHGLSLADESTRSADGGHIEPHCQSWVQLLETWLKNF